MINEMFQRQARRIESQSQTHAAEKRAIEYTQAQLLVMQAQLHWHASRYVEHADQVSRSVDTVTRIQHYLQTMQMDRARAVRTALHLAREVQDLRAHLDAKQPGKLQTPSQLVALRVTHR